MTAAARELVFPDAVEQAEDLFDRDDEVAKLRETLLRPARQTVVLLGGRLVGKTSVLNVVAHWAEAEASYLVIRLAHAGSREDLMSEIVHGIVARVGAGRPTSRGRFRANQQIGSVAQFVAIVRGLAGRASGKRLLLCLDEFDSLIQSCSAEAASQIIQFVSDISEHTGLPIRFLFTMSRIPDGLRRSYRSPFLNQATIVELAPWPEPEAEAYADWLLGAAHPLDPAEHAALFAAAGGHPYFTKAVLRALLAGAGTVATAIERAVRSRDVDLALSNIISVYLPGGAAGVLDRAAGPAGLTPADLRELPAPDAILDTLTDAGLLASEDRRRYGLRLGLWQQWRQWREPPAEPPVTRTRFLVRLARLPRWSSTGRGFRFGLVSVLVVLLGLAFGPRLLFPNEQVVFAPCSGTAGGLQVTASHPAFVSTGDGHELHVTVVNSSGGPLGGWVLVSFPPGGPGSVARHGNSTIDFDQLQPDGQQSLTMGFTHTQPGRLLPDTGAGVPIRLTVHVDGATCQSQRWTVPVAPVPYLRNLQRGAVALVFLLPAPMLIEWLARRFGTMGR